MWETAHSSPTVGATVGSPPVPVTRCGTRQQFGEDPILLTAATYRRDSGHRPPPYAPYPGQGV